jgi:hypothetical protein
MLNLISAETFDPFKIEMSYCATVLTNEPIINLATTAVPNVEW